MDPQNYARVLSYAICELTMPVKRHVYNFAANNFQSNLNHHLLTAAAKAAKRAKNRIRHRDKYRIKLSKMKSNNHNNCKYGQDSTNQLIAQNGLAFNQNDWNPEEKCIKKVEEIDSGKQISAAAVFNDHLCDETDDHKETYLHSTNIKLEGNEIVPVKQPSVGNDGESVEKAMKLNPQNGYNEKDCADFEENLTDPTDEMSGFYSDPLLLCSDQDFMISFRMSRTSFQKLLAFVAKDELEPIENIPLYKKVLIVLWLMGSSASYTDAAVVFSVSEEVAANCFFDVCATLYNGSDRVINWPSLTEGAEIANRIEEQFGFPGVVGVLGCHYFSIVIPKDAFSRKDHFNASLRTYCISLQIVCDDRLIIRDICPGLPGGKPAQSVLRESPLCEQLMNRDPTQRLVEPQKHILARSQYPQLPSMLTPYTEPEGGVGFGKGEVDFNALHESVCGLVDQTFLMLEARFPTLKLLDPEVATMVLVSACVIHNICMENDDIFETEYNVN